MRTTPSALEDLVVSHDEFRAGWEGDMNAVGYEEPHTSEDFAACPVCGGTYIGGVIEVAEIDGALYEKGRRSG